MRRLTLLIVAAFFPVGLVVVASPGMAAAASPPVVTHVIPNHGSTSGGKTITLFGGNFTGATAVDFGFTPAPFTVNSGHLITAVDPAGSPGTVDVTVTTPAGRSGTGSPNDQFTYVEHPPTVTGIAPRHGPTGGGTLVGITGANLGGATAVDFGSTPAESFTVNSGHVILASSPPGSAGTTVDVTVTTPHGTSATGPADDFSYEANLPTIQSLSPKHGTTKGGNKVSIFGDGFAGTIAVNFGSVPANGFQVVTGHLIVATAPAGVAGTTVDVTVTTPSGTSPTDTADQYTYVLVVPRVTDVLPNHGPATGLNTVTIQGSNFSHATAVDFGSNAAVSFAAVSGNAIVATAPAGVAGTTVDVTVTNANGSSEPNVGDHYTYDIPAS